jgi:mannose-6-phosphate isomerase-like protein (cupin superfamily)
VTPAKYIQSGIIEDYCFGFLTKEKTAEVENMANNFPIILEAITSNQEALEEYANLFKLTPSSECKSKIMNVFDNLIKERQASPNNLPLINKYSQKENWLKIVKPFLPPTLEKDKYHNIIQDEDNVFQLLLWSKSDYPNEEHTDLNETIYVLDGECECCVGDKVFPLKPGEMLEIPLYVSHNLIVTKGPLLAVVQRLKIA